MHLRSIPTRLTATCVTTVGAAQSKTGNNISLKRISVPKAPPLGKPNHIQAHLDTRTE